MNEEAILYWWAIVATLKRGELDQYRIESGTIDTPEADAYVLPNRIVFVLDPVRTGGITAQRWLDPATWHELSAALGGRRVFVSNADRLAVTVARTPGQDIL
ncbi:MAG: hypothetical protein GX620_10495 [Chloroflexi bacterium]|nr:hypothetical protein [Chloroflexota bacterium]